MDATARGALVAVTETSAACAYQCIASKAPDTQTCSCLSNMSEFVVSKQRAHRWTQIDADMAGSLAERVQRQRKVDL